MLDIEPKSLGELRRWVIKGMYLVTVLILLGVFLPSRWPSELSVMGAIFLLLVMIVKVMYLVKCSKLVKQVTFLAIFFIALSIALGITDDITYLRGPLEIPFSAGFKISS